MYGTDTKEEDVAQRVLVKLESMAVLSGDDPKLIEALQGLFFE